MDKNKSSRSLQSCGTHFKQLHWQKKPASTPSHATELRWTWLDETLGPRPWGDETLGISGGGACFILHWEISEPWGSVWAAAGPPQSRCCPPLCVPYMRPPAGSGEGPPLTSQVASPTAPLIDWTQNDLLGLPSLGLKACHFYASNFFRVALGRLIRAELIVQVQRKAQGQ